jgi:hypothetical protein
MKRILLLSKILSKFVEDIFIFIGLTIIVATTYSLNVPIGNYLLGTIFLIIGFILARTVRR